MTDEPISGEIVPAGDRKPSITMTDEMFELICADIADGITLRQICRRPDRPSKSAFYSYRDDPDCGEEERERRIGRFARARVEGFDAISEEIVDIIDDGTNDWVERENKDGSTYGALDREHVQRSKLRAETRLKLLAVWDPKRYGARVDHTSSDGSMTPRGLADFYGDDKPEK